MKRTFAMLLGAAALFAVSSAAQAAYTPSDPDIFKPTTQGKNMGEVLKGWTGKNTVDYAHGIKSSGSGAIGSKGVGFSAPGSSITGTMTGSATGISALPAFQKDGSILLAAGFGTSTLTFTLSQPAHYFGFDFASASIGKDVFNFYDGDVLVASVDAGDFGVNGYYANFTSNLPIDKVQIVAGGPGAVTISDIQVSSVPVPAALPLFGAAVAGLGAMGKRRRRKAAAAA